ncbi:hypothetical protein LGH83_13100 [Lichenihabitans sp. PAMC28606]|uniref:hypothetical protein n=1 Tax=Lichenihabitans sp. PAMC28606 TaxID=2880932 RepID=UPI001D09D353|nr:hypothetical protein [Lichenihabitans sp. PAMC28606]UDL93519.1 hypothetical protein LGH83_13100 [Lichenihabitans sp. PAMC28606]
MKPIVATCLVGLLASSAMVSSVRAENGVGEPALPCNSWCRVWLGLDKQPAAAPAPVEPPTPIISTELPPPPSITAPPQRIAKAHGAPLKPRLHVGDRSPLRDRHTPMKAGADVETTVKTTDTVAGEPLTPIPPVRKHIARMLARPVKPVVRQAFGPPMPPVDTRVAAVEPPRPLGLTGVVVHAAPSNPPSAFAVAPKAAPVPDRALAVVSLESVPAVRSAPLIPAAPAQDPAPIGPASIEQTRASTHRPVNPPLSVLATPAASAAVPIETPIEPSSAVSDKAVLEAQTSPPAAPPVGDPAIEPQQPVVTALAQPDAMVGAAAAPSKPSATGDTGGSASGPVIRTAMPLPDRAMLHDQAPVRTVSLGERVDPLPTASIAQPALPTVVPPIDLSRQGQTPMLQGDTAVVPLD